MTPTRRPARVVKVRKDGWIDLQYVAETVALRAELLEPIETDDKVDAG